MTGMGQEKGKKEKAGHDVSCPYIGEGGGIRCRGGLDVCGAVI
jgi:hypothetical protein